MEQQFGEVLDGVLLPSVRPADALPAVASSRRRRDELAYAWLMAKRTRSVHTAARYRNDVPGWKADPDSGIPIPGDPRPGASFFYWADLRGLDVMQMLPAHIDAYLHWLKNAEHGTRYEGKTRLAASTRLGKLNAVRSFYRYCQANQQVHYNPAEHVDGPNVDNRKSKTVGLELEQLTVMLKIAQKRGRREYALIQLLAGTGLRISEAIGADTADLRQEGGAWYLYVVRKGYEDKAPVQVPDPAARALRRYLRGRRGPLFLDEEGKRMSRQAAGNRVRSIARIAVGDPKAMISPHSLRHTTTTLLLNAGVSLRSVQEYMGHRSGETTARYDRADRARNNPAAATMADILADDLPDYVMEA